jgi:hypothetical protein
MIAPVRQSVTLTNREKKIKKRAAKSDSLVLEEKRDNHSQKMVAQ